MDKQKSLFEYLDKTLGTLLLEALTVISRERFKMTLVPAQSIYTQRPVQPPIPIQADVYPQIKIPTLHPQNYTFQLQPLPPEFQQYTDPSLRRH